MPRLLFEKKNDAVWVSHLDLMRIFQRTFKRAGLHLTHTQGFNPRPSVSIALPLSVGVESKCELLDFDLDDEKVDNDSIMERLNGALVPGVKVLQVYDTGRKIKELAFLHCTVFLEYDKGIPHNAVSAISSLFSQDSLLVWKKGKNGMVEQDIIPLIQSLAISESDNGEVILDGIISCQNPSLNPMQLATAVMQYLPELKPDFVKCRRNEIYDIQKCIFR